MRPSTIILLALVLVTCLFVGYVEGFTNPFAAWNCLPLLIAAGIVVSRDRGLVGTLGSRASRTSVAMCAFAAVSVLTILAVHAAWLLDWRGTATGSSTSAVVFVTLPIVALMAGCMGAAVGWVLERLRRGGS